MRHVGEKIILVLCIVFFGIAAMKFAEIGKEYHDGQKEYEELKEYTKEQPSRMTEEPGENRENGAEMVQEIDFAGLRKINEDIVAWIQIPGIDVDYPVVQGEDNEYYLYHTFRKEANKAGSIFLDYRNRADFTEQCVIIYGHNMKDGSMFHVLRKFQDIDFYREHGEIWLYLPNGSTQVYEIVEYEEVRATGEVYKMGNKNIEENEIILSTCSSRSDRRLIVKGILKK